jgi:hypothetical protein
MRGGGAREHAETPSGQQPADRMLARPTPPADTLRTASGTSSLGLPDVGGWCCAGRRRAVIVVLTARTAEFKVAVALNAGADG